MASVIWSFEHGKVGVFQVDLVWSDEPADQDIPDEMEKLKCTCPTTQKEKHTPGAI